MGIWIMYRNSENRVEHIYHCYNITNCVYIDFYLLYTYGFYSSFIIIPPSVSATLSNNSTTSRGYEPKGFGSRLA